MTKAQARLAFQRFFGAVAPAGLDGLRTPTPAEGRPDLMSPEAMGEFVIKLAQHFGIDRMHAVGPDVGTLALLFAATRGSSKASW
jgi:hypothetical protein